MFYIFIEFNNYIFEYIRFVDKHKIRSTTLRDIMERNKVNTVSTILRLIAYSVQNMKLR